jgi:hypothetical protein
LGIGDWGLGFRLKATTEAACGFATKSHRGLEYSGRSHKSRREHSHPARSHASIAFFVFRPKHQRRRGRFFRSDIVVAPQSRIVFRFPSYAAQSARRVNQAAARRTTPWRANRRFLLNRFLRRADIAMPAQRDSADGVSRDAEHLGDRTMTMATFAQKPLNFHNHRR